jgi:pyroglutamyl-peptidase
MKLLISGFEPFNGQAINPSREVVAALAGRGIPGADLHSLVLPVDAERAPRQLLEFVDEWKPGVVVCLGEAGGRARISIERVAVNLLDFRIPDNAAQQPVDQPAVDDAPDAYFSTLPTRAMFEAARDAGVPAELSMTAGTYLCNLVSFCVLHHIATGRLRCRAGFIHLPFLPEQAAREHRAVPSMALETMVRGVEAGLGVLVG